MGSNLVTVTQTSDIASVLSKEFLDIQATRECRFTLKLVSNMTRTQSPRHPCYILITFTCIHFISTFFARGISLVVTESHALHTTWNGLITNYLAD